jgi:hypothetical protein
LNYYFECAKIVIYHAFENKKVFRILAAMQAQFFLLFLFISGTYSSMAQGIRGRITNAKGEPLPYVTIYSPTAKAGANSNVNGAFELKLPKGTHQINFQSIGSDRNRGKLDRKKHCIRGASLRVK